MAVVDEMYGDFKDVVAMLADAKEVSLQIMLERHLQKTLLLSAASYFEYTLSREVRQFVEEVAASNTLVCSLVENKAIERQYHSWFDWKSNNANKFFSLFGEKFRSHMAARLVNNKPLAEGISAFMEIGRDRNSLVHSDYASYTINKTPEEIFNSYRKATGFVVTVGAELRACSKSRIN